MGETEKFLLNLILKEKKIIIWSTIVGLVFFLTYYFFFYTALYTTKSNLFIKNVINPGIVAQNPDQSSIRSESGYSNPLFNLYELVKSENIAHKVYDRIKEKYPQDLAKLGVISKESFNNVYIKLINSEVIPSTDVLSVTLQWPSRKNSQDVLNIVIDEFRKENLQIRRSLDTQKRLYLETQTNEISEQLEALRNELKKYKIDNKITDASTEALNLAEIRLGLVKEISMLKAQIEYNEKKYKEYSKQLGINDPITALKAAGIGNDPYLIKLSQDLAATQANYAALKSKFTDKYFEVVTLKSQIDNLKQQINERKQETAQKLVLPRAIYDGPSTNIVSEFALVYVERLSQEVMITALEKSINDILEQEKDMHTKQIGLDNLTKQEEAFATAYQNIKAKQLDAKIQENEIVDNILTLQSPTMPSALQLGLITKFVGFLLFGALAGLGIAYIKQGVEDKWVSLDELKHITGQEILGVIPWLKDETTDTAFKIYDTAYTNIASEIITKANDINKSILCFISTNMYNNKSVITNNVAKYLTSLEKKSIIIDFSQDFAHKPDITSAVNFIYDLMKKENLQNSKLTIGSPLNEITAGNSGTNEISIEEFINKHREQILSVIKESVEIRPYTQDGNNSQLYFLGINQNKSNLKYFVSSRGFSLLLQCLKREFDFVLINTPHGNFMLPETHFIKKNSEAVAIIASMDSNREGLIKLVKNITESGQKILGIITREKDTEMEKFFNKVAEASSEE